MPAVAALVNTAPTKETQRIHLFYNTANAQLGLALKSASNDDDNNKTFAASEVNEYQGYILNPSERQEIDCDTYRGMNVVVAVTKPWTEVGTEPTVNNISMVSPIYRKLATTALANTRVSMCSAGDEAWVYFLSGAQVGKMSIMEYNFNSGATSTFVPNQDVTNNCSLAAYYDTTKKQRLVIYQEVSEGHLKEFNVNLKQSWDIDDTGDAKDKTSIAVAVYKNDVYLYYVDRKSNIRRIAKEGGTWGDAKFVRGSAKVAEESQITVAAANGINHIFYTPVDDDTTFAHVKDVIEGDSS